MNTWIQIWWMPSLWYCSKLQQAKCREEDVQTKHYLYRELNMTVYIYNPAKSARGNNNSYYKVIPENSGNNFPVTGWELIQRIGEGGGGIINKKGEGITHPPCLSRYPCLSVWGAVLYNIYKVQVTITYTLHLHTHIHYTYTLRSGTVAKRRSQYGEVWYTLHSTGGVREHTVYCSHHKASIPTSLNCK